MNTFELMYLPPYDSSAAITEAIIHRLNESGKDRFHYRYFAAIGTGSIDIQSLPPRHAQHKFGLQITVSPGMLAQGRGAFSSFAGAALIKPLLGEISRAVGACLELGKDAAPIGIEHLTLLRGTMEVCFLLDEFLATSTLMDLAHHTKIVRDFGSPMPSRSWKTGKRQPPRVQWSTDHKTAMQIELSFGEARAYLANMNHTAACFSEGSEDRTDAGTSLSRSILCVEITADIGNVIDPADPTATLPARLDRWYQSVMKLNPYAFIWKAFAWECWLNEDFSNADTDFGAVELSDGPRELLEHYLRGGSYRENPVVREDYGRFLPLRRALIVKAGIDLLNPWRNFRLNKARALRPLLAFDKRLKPEDHPILGASTLTPTTALQHGLALNAAARTNSGRGVWL